MRVLVLGAGRMGLAAPYSLAHNSEGVESVTVADVDEGRARAVAETLRDGRVRPAQVDVEDHARVVELMRGHDAALSCVTYFHNLQLARAAVEARTHFCALGGNNAVVDAELALDEEASAAGVNIVPGCGPAARLASGPGSAGGGAFKATGQNTYPRGRPPADPPPAARLSDRLLR